MRRVGFLINPIAGLGGRVGLKGTDGKVADARERGATPRAPDRARRALDGLAAHEVDVITVGGVMGADVARKAGFEPVVASRPAAGPSADISATSVADTRRAVAAFVAAGVDVILFVGGDGTAVDVAQTLAGLEADVPMLGVPAGVKVYSGVFAVDPEAAGEIAATFQRVERADLQDLDEDAFRDGAVVPELQTTALTPVAELRQSPKERAGGSVETLAAGVAQEVDSGTTYVFGPGSTVGEIERQLGIDPSPLGVDVWRDGEVLVADGGQSAILDALGDRNVVIVSPIGGQGFVFGRGNQQLSPAVLRECDVEIVASRRKLDGLGVLRVDTGDPDLDETLRGWQRVRVGRRERRFLQLV
ncbi:N-acetylglucosamine-1-phosphate uridyltransferase [Halorhabdus sp. CBA1104]|uniref:ATP-NAD kinase family protein n=1 Tax=unclassified Halorhabdus TaxID=2621901 RepID=UPI0012B2A5B3|nr:MULTISPECIES: ATP-NAD kinase family protein [unclassified Halorhabdus]QGN06809.1 N-acetylglucosamine-1-phosphate uridyltransferase [Halorhabdus sp. CBA1104]